MFTLKRLFVSVLLAPGLLSAAGKDKPVKQSAAGTDAAVARFEVLGDRTHKALNESPPEFTQPGYGGSKEWWRRKLYTSNFSIDVRRTDSLISPIVGEMRFDCQSRGAIANSEDEARSAPDSFDTKKGAAPDYNQCKASYAVQSGRWVFNSFSCVAIPVNELGQIGSGPNKLREIGPTDTMIYGKCRALLANE